MVTCSWSANRPTELSPCQVSVARLSSAPRILISTSSLPLLALPWRPPSDFPQTDIPSWPVWSCPEPLEVGDIWDHTGERKKLLAHLSHCGEWAWKEAGGQEKPFSPQMEGEEGEVAPGSRFLANFLGLQSSETSAQIPEVLGHAPLLNPPLRSPSLAPQAFRN